MRRVAIAERADWRARAAEAGFAFHTIDGEPYWDESAWYAFTLREIEEGIEAPTEECNGARSRRRHRRQRAAHAAARHPGAVPRLDREQLAPARPASVRPHGLRVGRPRSGEAARTELRHADVAVRGRVLPVAMARRATTQRSSAARHRPVQLDLRKSCRGVRDDRHASAASIPLRRRA